MNIVRPKRWVKVGQMFGAFPKNLQLGCLCCFGAVTGAKAEAAAAAGEIDAEVAKFCSCFRVADVTISPFTVSVENVGNMLVLIDFKCHAWPFSPFRVIS